MITSLDQKACANLLGQNYIGQLAYIYNDAPYVVPITYFYDKTKNHVICYSGTGHKLNAMRKHTTVTLSVSEVLASHLWKSVMAHGSFEEVQGSDAKAYLHQFSIGIKDIIMQQERKDLDYISEFSSKIYNDDIPIVFLIKVDHMTGRSRSK